MTDATRAALARVAVMNSADCPRCGQSAGHCCMGRGGKRLPQPHPERTAAYGQQHPPATSRVK